MSATARHSSPAVDPDDLAEFDAIVTGRTVQAVYQPIVDLDSGETVAWEALARGPRGSQLEYPDRLFGVAAALGRTDELDFVCRSAATEGAISAGLGRRQGLFVNVEPSASTANVPQFLIRTRQRAREHLLVTVEITERALTANPAELIALLKLYRDQGWALALDDVGVDPRSVSLMPFVRPEVIKLDMSYVQQAMTRERARTVHAVMAEAERSGATVLMEGIETTEHLAIARALGASLGQGWYFGRPGALTPAPDGAPGIGHPRGPDADPQGDTPFEAIRHLRPTRSATKRQLLEMSLALEDEALGQGEAAVLLSTFQDASYFTPKTRRRYERIAARAAFVGALAVRLGREPAPGVRGAAFDADDALRGEWDVVVLAPHFAAAFVAHDEEELGRPDFDRHFQYALTYDRDLVTALATRLMKRVAPSDMS